MYKVKVYVTLRESVLDPQGTAVRQSLNSLSFQEVDDVRIGKYMELTLGKGDRDVEEAVTEMCEKPLSINIAAKPITSAVLNVTEQDYLVGFAAYVVIIPLAFLVTGSVLWFLRRRK